MNGPVILVGHSYGGVIITEAGANANMKNLVMLPRFSPTRVRLRIAERENPVGSQVDQSRRQTAFFYVDPADFHADFAADVPAGTADFMARIASVAVCENRRHNCEVSSVEIQAQLRHRRH